jgi:hypothetical protein
MVARVTGRVAAGSGRRHGRPARWAVGLSALSGVAIAASIAAFAIASAVGGTSAAEDNWVAYLVASMGFAGLIGSLTAFVLAIVAKVERERWELLWVPLCLFPVFFLLLVLGEAFWWE